MPPNRESVYCTYPPVCRANSGRRLLARQFQKEVGVVAILLVLLVPVPRDKALGIKALEGLQGVVLVHGDSSGRGQLGAPPAGSEAADGGDKGSGGLRRDGRGGGGLALSRRTWGGQRRLVRNPVLGGVLSV